MQDWVEGFLSLLRLSHMNTPAHLMINLFVLGRKETPRHHSVILAGAFLPDVPMFLFYFVEKVVLRVPEYLIWSRDYYLPSWQNFIDCFNSLPLIAVGLLISLIGKQRAAQLFFISMMLHVFCDFPVHHDDAHRHFFPFSDWRFESPVSYWDPQHYGLMVTGVEIGIVLVCATLLIYWSKNFVTAWLVGVVGVIYAAFFLYAFFVWV